ncbi:MAG: hypothetical protein K9M07_02580 [Simkaniaceae bacterium]|nr:hypothetical protein [Simkaniaceae bacterium]MCF7852108.1 hypothetical protein [Simkaniaceae bacterium]
MKIAVITAQGFGDGLMMMTVSHQLKQHGHDVITYNDHLPQMASWFEGHVFEPQPIPNTDFSHFDYIILEHDNSPKSKNLIERYRSKLTILYPSYDARRHPPLSERDAILDPQKPVVCSLAESMSHLFHIEYALDNGLMFNHKTTKSTRRIAIHPTSSTPLRTWSLDRFIHIANWLMKRGFSPFFCLSAKEHSLLKAAIPAWIETPQIGNLSELASLLLESKYVIGNESGIVHLASNLDLPFLVIAGNHKRIRQWQPGWKLGTIATPPSWLPNIKGMRLRENHWQKWITCHQVKSLLLQDPLFF